MTARQRLSRINAIVETMGPQRQKVFRLHKLEGLTHQEVAARLGISRSAVEKHISMALKTLVAALS